MTTPTVEQVLATLDEVVEEFGADYIYPDDHRDAMQTCQYVYKGKPDCIAAQVFVRLGVPVSQLKPYEGKPADMVFGRLLGRGRNAESVLTFAQSKQDGRSTWGEARDAAYQFARDQRLIK